MIALISIQHTNMTDAGKWQMHSTTQQHGTYIITHILYTQLVKHLTQVDAN